MKHSRTANGTLIICLLSTGGLFAQQNTGFSSVVNGNNAFAFDLYAKLASGKGNIFFSPYSISTALAMTYAGARGKTESQMARVMYFRKDRKGFHKTYGEMQSRINGVQKEGNVKLCVANSLWMQKDYKFLPSFLALTQTNYDAAFNYVDYKKDAEAARVSINTWVAQKTNDKIKDLIGQGALDATTKMVLANAIYFKGSWAQKFDTAMTKEQPFRISSKDSVNVRMMTLYGQEFGYLKDNKVECIRLPYAGNDLSMIIILPKKRDGLNEIESTLTKGQVNGFCANLRKTEVTVCVPKFKITRDFLLNKQLSSLGMSDAFGRSADFSGMDDTRSLFISAVIHKAFVDVNEEGTEAAAATGVVMMTKCMPGTPPMFCADHPFIFLIRDNATGSILFMGRIVNPME
jgi:serpin B